MQARAIEDVRSRVAGDSRAQPAEAGVLLVAARDPQVLEVLRRAHHEIATIEGGVALRQTLEDPFLASAIDVVVAEVELEGCSALQALSEIPRAGRPPVVLLSPNGSRVLFERAREVGAFVVLHEPVLGEHLRAVVARLVRGTTPSA